MAVINDEGGNGVDHGFAIANGEGGFGAGGIVYAGGEFRKVNGDHGSGGDLAADNGGHNGGGGIIKGDGTRADLADGGSYGHGI